MISLNWHGFSKGNTSYSVLASDLDEEDDDVFVTDEQLDQDGKGEPRSPRKVSVVTIMCHNITHFCEQTYPGID